MDDIEEVIKEAKKISFKSAHRDKILNATSDLPASKKNLKIAIKERIQLLCAAYISLASFVPECDIDILLDSKKRPQHIKIFKRVLKELNKNEKEIKNFDPFSY